MNNYMRLCQLCTNNKNVSFTIHDLDSDGKRYIDTLEAIIPEIVTCKIKLPNGICRVCAVQLNQAYTFIKQCFESQIILKQHLNEKLCRLCAGIDNIVFTLNTMDSDNVLLSCKLETIASELLECDEKLSDCICSACSIRLNATYKFVEKCFKSQEIFKRYARKHKRNSEIKNNKIAKDPINSCQNKEGNNSNIGSDLTKDESINEKRTALDLQNVTNIKVKDSLESGFLNLHSEILSAENSSDLMNEQIDCDDSEKNLSLISQENVNVSEIMKNKIAKVPMNSCQNKEGNNSNFIIDLTEDESINEKPTSLDSQNVTNIKVVESLKSEYLNLHSEILIAENSSDLMNEQIDCDNFEIDLNLIKKENVIEYHNSELFEFVNVNWLQNDPLLQENYEVKIEESAIETEEKLKTKTTDYYIKLFEAKPYKCEICNRLKAFGLNHKLITHLRLHSDETAENSEKDLKNHVRKQRCENCKRYYKYCSCIRSFSYKAYRCGICDETFDVNQDLTKHIQLCLHSDKTAENSEKDLEKHVRKQRCENCKNYHKYCSCRRSFPDKAYICGICGETFDVNQDLRKHIHTHKNTET